MNCVIPTDIVAWLYVTVCVRKKKLRYLSKLEKYDFNLRCRLNTVLRMFTTISASVQTNCVNWTAQLLAVQWGFLGQQEVLMAGANDRLSVLPCDELVSCPSQLSLSHLFWATGRRSFSARCYNSVLPLLAMSDCLCKKTWDGWIWASWNNLWSTLYMSSCMCA